MDFLLINLLPIIGVILGATLQFIFSKNKDNRQLKKTLEIQAYTDYLRAIAGLSMATRFKDENKKQEFYSLLIEAKCRILIYGSKKVIQSVAEFGRAGANFDTNEQKFLFVKIGQDMRNEGVIISEFVSNQDFSQLFFSVDIE